MTEADGEKILGKEYTYTVTVLKPPPLRDNVWVCVTDVAIVEITVLVRVTVTVSWVPEPVFVGAAGCENPVVSENPGPRKGCSGGGEDGCG